MIVNGYYRATEKEKNQKLIKAEIYALNRKSEDDAGGGASSSSDEASIKVNIKLGDIFPQLAQLSANGGNTT